MIFQFSKKRWDDIFCSMKCHVYRLLKSSCFELSEDGNTVLSEIKVNGKIIFTDYWKVFVLNFSEVKIWSFLSQKVDGKMILLGFHDIPGLWKYGFVCSVNNYKNAFYFILKVLSVLEIFTFLSRFFAYAEKKAMIDFNIFDVTDW